MSEPSIEGTYVLVRRELPDGRAQLPPALKGMMTYTKGYRNFSVVWRDDEGRHYSECYAARYTLNEEKYTETSEYLIVNDEIGGEDVLYDLSARTGTSEVSIEDGVVRFDLPQAFERRLDISVEFDGSQLTATSPDQFVDHWERVP